LAWRVIVIRNPARLRVENSQIVIEQEDRATLPLEDIAVLVLESPEVLLSSSFLSRCAEVGTAVLTCDGSHLPVSASLPMAGHSRLSGIQRLQLGTTVPFRKRCWQAIIRQKIQNQAECLRLLDRRGWEAVRGLVDTVTSGDTRNVESSAAREYFRLLFGPTFVRGRSDVLNSGLNYGYAVLRGAVARALSAHGFLLSQGIHHRNELNPYNLADDFLEPLRPIVDFCVATELSGESEFQKEHRQKLVSVLSWNVLIDGERHSVLHSADLTAASFISACRQKSPVPLKLPALLSPEVHAYE